MGNHRFKKWRRRLARLALAVGLLTLLALTGFKIALERLVARYPFEPEKALDVGVSRIFVDRFGESIFAELSPEGQWRLPIALDQVATNMTLATLALEDKRFWDHQGVDWLAGARSVVANLRHQDIVTGASTLSMQLARLLYPEPRSLGRKLRQIARAIDMERHFSKEWILEQYFNHAPYGGNLVGVEAASRYYFRKSARDLDLYQSALLAGIPQRPTALRPDRHPERAARRQRFALERMASLGWIPPEVAETVPRLELAPTPLNEDGARIGIRQREPVFATSLMANALRATISLDTQEMARGVLERGLERVAHAEHGAVVVVDNASAETLAVVGSLGIHHPKDNWVNAALAPRSPGSALKPFIYLAALDAGRLIPETMVWDGPLLNRDYRPENFDGTYRGWISARDALALSLNTPAVRLLRDIGPENLIGVLRACGLRRLNRTAADTGLALALGGVETTLLELTGAYAGLASNGRFRAPKTTQTIDDPPSDYGQPFSVGSIQLLRRMLSAAPLPGGSGEPVCWKTGTSSGARDAWCVAFNPELTIGVWVGNKSGAPAPGSSGATAAAPIVADFLSAYYQRRPRPTFPETTTGLREVAICASTGLRARGSCRDPSPALAVIGAPLRPCLEDHGAIEDTPPTTRRPTILSPKERAYFALNGAPPKIALRAEPRSAVRWFHNGRLLTEEGPQLARPFPIGSHQLICVAPDGRTSDTVYFEVR